jgi:hypothetical protein
MILTAFAFGGTSYGAALRVVAHPEIGIAA